jgi:hypothetical protein
MRITRSIVAVALLATGLPLGAAGAEGGAVPTEAELRAWAERESAKMQELRAGKLGPIEIRGRFEYRPRLTAKEVAELNREVAGQPGHPRFLELNLQRVLVEKGGSVTEFRFAFEGTERFRYLNQPSVLSPVPLNVTRQGATGWVMSGDNLVWHDQSQSHFPPRSAGSLMLIADRLLFGGAGRLFKGAQTIELTPAPGNALRARLTFPTFESAVILTGRWDAAVGEFFVEQVEGLNAGTLRLAPWRPEPALDGWVSGGWVTSEANDLGDAHLTSVSRLTPDEFEQLLRTPKQGSTDPWLGTVKLESLVDWTVYPPRSLDPKTENPLPVPETMSTRELPDPASGFGRYNLVAWGVGVGSLGLVVGILLRRSWGRFAA